MASMHTRVGRLAVAAAAAGALVLGLGGTADAGGGSYRGRLVDDCGSASGTYHWDYSATYNSKNAYHTDRDFKVTDLCKANGRDVSLSTKYTKWTGSAWTSDGKYHRIGGSGTGSNVADVIVYSCEVGHPGTCVALHAS
ncbi:hypothetical protein [Kitasatospora sp. NPDC088134]|uniref:hypothetical protein n=1 Tax=Kitasatospora sp. NPDC088134 TaxID=3364071 RepID=UPI0037F84F96